MRTVQSAGVSERFYVAAYSSTPRHPFKLKESKTNG
jgi:hypothetical protein